MNLLQFANLLDGGDVDVSQAYNVSALTIFKHPLDMAPSAKGWFCFERNFPHLRAVDKLSAPGQRERVAKPLPYSEGKLAEAFWDGPVFAVSMCVAEALNGMLGTASGMRGSATRRRR